LKPPEAVVVIVVFPLVPWAREPEFGDADIAKAGAVTVIVTVDVWVMPPPVPVTVTVYEPAGVDEPAASVMVDDPDPGAAIDVGLNAAVAPVGSPDALRAIAELKPPETVVVILLVPLDPWATETEVGEADIAKAGAVTMRVTVDVCVTPPPAPVTVMA
jgi:hypothetical protein